MRWFLACALTAVAIGTTSIAKAEDAPSAGIPGSIYLGQAPYSLASRNALVIGVPSIKDGRGFIDLKNPKNDADKVAAALRSHGFSVTNLNEVYPPDQMTRQNIKLALYDFSVLLRSIGGVGLIYFAGHGFERNGQQYLVPYDGYLRFDRDLTEEFIPVALLYDTFSYAKNSLAIIILDICRDSPWNKPLEAFGTPSYTPPVQDSDTIFLANSTMSGNAAHDGSGDLSPYAQAFVNAMTQPDTGIWQFFTSIGLSVHQKLPKEQTPTLLVKPHEFIFFPTKSSFDQEQSVYQTGVQRKSRPLLQQFTYQYPAGYFDRAAKDYLEKGDLAADSSDPGTSASGSLFRAQSVDAGPQPASVRTGTSLVLASGRKLMPADFSSARPLDYVKSGQSQIRSPAPAGQTIQLSYTNGPTPNIEILDEKSSAALNDLKNRANSNAKIEILGYRYKGNDGAVSNELLLLTRQAAALDTLSEAGFEPTNIAVSSMQTADSQLADKVEVHVTFPPAPSAPMIHEPAKKILRKRDH